MADRLPAPDDRGMRFSVRWMLVLVAVEAIPFIAMERAANGPERFVAAIFCWEWCLGCLGVFVALSFIRDDDQAGKP